FLARGPRGAQRLAPPGPLLRLRGFLGTPGGLGRTLLSALTLAQPEPEGTKTQVAWRRPRTDPALLTPGCSGRVGTVPEAPGHRHPQHPHGAEAGLLTRTGAAVAEDGHLHPAVGQRKRRLQHPRVVPDVVAHHH